MTDPRRAVLDKMLTRYLHFLGKNTPAQLEAWAATYLKDLAKRGVSAELLHDGIERVTFGDPPWVYPYPPSSAEVLHACGKIVSELRIEARQLCGNAYHALRPAERQRLCLQSLERFDEVHRLSGGLSVYDLGRCREMKGWLALPPPEMVSLALPAMAERTGKHGTLKGTLREFRG